MISLAEWDPRNIRPSIGKKKPYEVSNLISSINIY